ncbi:MAG: hypothetical protein ACI4BD_01085 [Paludibacteraceae bacterium]
MKQRVLTLLCFCLLLPSRGFAECYVLEGESCTLAYVSGDGNTNGTYSSVFSLPYAGQSLSFTYALAESASNWHTLSVEWSKDNSTWSTFDGWTSGEITDATARTQVFTLSEEAKYIRFKRTANKGTFSSGQKAFNVNAINVVMADSFMLDKTSLAFPNMPVNTQSEAQTVAVRFQNAGTEMSVSSSSEDFAASIAEGSAMDCRGTKTLQVVFQPTTEGNKEATITVTTNADGHSDTIKVSGSAFKTVEPTHTFAGSASYRVDESIDLASVWTSNSPAACTYSIVSFTPLSAGDGGAAPTLAADNTLPLTQAGTLVVQLAQDETDGFYSLTSTQTIQITKYDVSASISQTSATWDAIISEPFAISYDLTDYTVVALDPAIATYADGSIQTYAETGTARFALSRAEDYKYSPLAQTLSISVAAAQESCSYEKADEVSFQGNSSYTYELPYACNKLSIQLRHQSGGSATAVLTGYDSEGVSVQTICSLSLSSDYATYSYDIDTRIRKITCEYTGAGNNAKANAKNLVATRAVYLRSSESEKNLESTMGTDATGTIDIQYSSCSGSTIKVISDNPKIKVSLTSFSAEDIGTQTISITCDASEIGAESATITLYDQSKKATVDIVCTITGLPQTITWENAPTACKVGDKIPLEAKASSGLEVVYYLDQTGEYAEIDWEDNVLKAIAVGAVQLRVSQGGNAQYEPAEDLVLTIAIGENTSTATEQVEDGEQVAARKMIRNGQLYILRNGMLYDARGRLVVSE